MKRLILIGVAAVLLGSCGNRVAQAKDTETKTSETTDTVSVAEDIQEENMAESVVVENETLFEASGDSTTVRYLKALPDGFSEDDLFGLVLNFGGYAMDAAAWPMPDGDWLITDHWCAEEDGSIFKVDEDGNEYEVVYEDPFKGEPYPVVHKPDLSFSTRNYGGQTINLYAAPDSDEVLCSTNFKEITLNVIAADLKTRRLLVCSNPKDWCWEKPGEETEKPADIDPDESEDEYDFVEEKYPFVDLRGWIDEEWVCGSTMTTCP